MILASAILCYISAAITTAAALASTTVGSVTFSPLNLLDVVLILVLGLLIHLKQSLPAGIILLAYSVINVIIMSIMFGKFGGWLLLVAGGLAFYSTYKLNKDYKAFNSNASQIVDNNIPKEL